MSKLLLLSIVIATIALPLRHAGAEDARAAMRKMVVEFCWFNLFYVIALVYIVPRLL
jgi:hypothetical protein